MDVGLAAGPRGQLSPPDTNWEAERLRTIAAVWVEPSEWFTCRELASLLPFRSSSCCGASTDPADWMVHYRPNIYLVLG